ncbi:unnamed protein product [Urochloa decumbens]|uniref:DUF4378 domain-containing protein n=1 Tax=Urochloa decumbens TaxID=240449 RepID=A0ABC9CZM2_9POAL
MRRTKQSSSSFWSSRRRASSAPATPRPEPAASSDPPPIGCMSMVHYLIFAPGAGCVGRPPASSNAVVTPHGGESLSPDHGDGRSSSKSGFEAPRNSLDLDADNPNDIQIGVQVEPVFDALARTTMRRARPTAPSSEAETPRTPSLVARLMGIDGLPDNQPSPSPAAKHAGKTSSSSKKHAADKENYCYHCSSPASPADGSGGKGGEKKKRVIPESMNRREPLRSLSCNVGEARSLAETPRASWDGPRLSLKETVLDRAAQYMSMPSSPTSAGAKKKNKSSSSSQGERAAKEHARQILRQAKENVATRKAAADKRRSSNKENVTPTVEDKLVVQDAGKPTVLAAKAQEHPPSPRMPLAPPPQRAKPSRPPPPPPPLDPPTRARKPDGCERFATRIKKPAPAAIAAAGGQQPPPAAALPSSAPAATSASSAGKQQRHAPPPPPLEEDPEYVYLRAVLERGGFLRSPPRRPFFRQGHSPVDPIVFHLLELELPADDEARLGTLRHRWNRKLLFHLAQDLLADLLLPMSGGGAAAARPPPPTGTPLLGKVWRKVRAFPAADCRVVGDIDALVARDLEGSSSSPPARRLAGHPAVAEEGRDVAEEVADRVLDALLGESVSHLFACCA